jgi:hypothetical protein
MCIITTPRLIERKDLGSRIEGKDLGFRIEGISDLFADLQIFRDPLDPKSEIVTSVRREL